MITIIKKKKTKDYPVWSNGDRLIFIAKIKYSKIATDSYKKRLALLWAIEKGVSLKYADFSHADLSKLTLNYVSFNYVNFEYANFKKTKIHNCYFHETNLNFANLERTEIKNTSFVDCCRILRTNFKYSKIYRCSFNFVWFERADFKKTKIKKSFFTKVWFKEIVFSKNSIHNCNFTELCSLKNTIGDGRYIKNYKTDLIGLEYPIAYTHDYMQIGITYKGDSIAGWKIISDDKIREMDGQSGLHWWIENKREIFQHIEDNPAENGIGD